MIKKSNLLCVTGCSHTAGSENYDPFYIKNYNSFVDTYKNKPKAEIIKKIFLLRSNYILSKKGKSLVNKLAKNPGSFGFLIERYFSYMERKNSWPNRLKNLFPNYEIVNLAKAGGSFKRSISNFINFLKKNRYKKIIAIHQVPSLGRTYIKIKGVKYDVTSSEFLSLPTKVFPKDVENKKVYDILEAQYKKIIQRDINSNYFVRSTKKHLALLKKISLQFNVKNYFITENIEDYQIFANEKVILNNFKIFRDNYKKGFSHVIDDQFKKDLAEIINRFLIEKHE